MAKLQAREIPVYSNPEVVPEEVTSKMIAWYKFGDATINKILHSTNIALAKFNRRPISFVDVYSILFAASKADKDISTAAYNHYAELSIDEFIRFFRAWQKGETYATCYAAIGRDGHNKNFCKRVFKSLMDRWRHVRDVKTKTRLAPGDVAIRDVLAYAERRVFSEGRAAIVVFLDALPTDLILECVKSVDGFIEVFGPDIRRVAELPVAIAGQSEQSGQIQGGVVSSGITVGAAVAKMDGDADGETNGDTNGDTNGEELDIGADEIWSITNEES
jgi:hypothetical protein